MELFQGAPATLLAKIGQQSSLTLSLIKQDACTNARERLEFFIRERFAEHYGAHIQHFMPCLLGLDDEQETLRAAVGVRNAAQGVLFLERYLDVPIEEAIAQRSGRSIARDEIVEVGNLGALEAGHARLLIIAMTHFLVSQGFRWVTFTGTLSLLNSFQRLGLSPISLGLADPQRMGADLADWGSYYATKPQVMVGDIWGGHTRLEAHGLYRRLGLEAFYPTLEVSDVACG